MRPRARKPWHGCEIVFITAYDQYAVEAFEQGVVDYVLKPAERERLQVTVDRVRKRLAARAGEGPDASGMQRPAAEARREDEPGRRAAPALDPGHRRHHHPDDPGRRRALLHLRREVHASADGDARGADPKADQGARRRARCRSVLADPSLDARQRACHRRRRPATCAAASSSPCAATPKSSRSAAATRACSRACRRTALRPRLRRRAIRREAASRARSAAAARSAFSFSRGSSPRSLRSASSRR